MRRRVTLDELRGLMMLANDPLQGPCDAIRFDQAAGTYVRQQLDPFGLEATSYGSLYVHVVPRAGETCSLYASCLVCGVHESMSVEERPDHRGVWSRQVRRAWHRLADRCPHAREESIASTSRVEEIERTW